MWQFLEFVKWFLKTFTTRTHYIRFLGTVIVFVTIAFLCSDKPVPDAWWFAFGGVIGYYFKQDNRD